MLPFSEREFLAVFEQYNESVWPMQVVLYLVGWIAVGLALSRKPLAGRLTCLMLGGLWLWIGAAYHLWQFAQINPAAYVFGILFIVQSVLFFYAGAIRSKLIFQPRFNSFGVAGTALIVFALLIYPLLNSLLGHHYPESPTFGLPCPTTIFTFGLLLWTDKRVPVSLLVVPILWAMIGTSAAFLLGIWEDMGLLVAGIVAIPMLLKQDDRRKKSCQHQGIN